MFIELLFSAMVMSNEADAERMAECRREQANAESIMDIKEQGVLQHEAELKLREHMVTNPRILSMVEDAYNQDWTKEEFAELWKMRCLSRTGRHV